MSLSFFRLVSASSRLVVHSPRQNIWNPYQIRCLTAAPRVKDSSKIERKHRSPGPLGVRTRPNLSGRRGRDEDEGHNARSRGRRRKFKKATPPRKLVLPDMGLTPTQLAALADVSSDSVLLCARELDESIATEESILSPSIVELVTEELSLHLEFRAQTLPLISTVRMENGGGERRIPVVTVMGHVDHGKTSLLDAFRKSDVAENEVGGITQSVAAFQVPLRAKSEQPSASPSFATFIDTPGHAAFKTMRANGTVATDIVILVVAANDGVMPQTKESATLARAADVPIIVAINKCDVPGADPDSVRYQLLESLGLNTEQLGGDVQCIDISAKTGQNLPQLLEAISLQAEMLQLNSKPQERATGICLESRVDRALGSVATVVVRSGTLRQGDFVAFQSPKALHGDLFGKIRGLLDRNGSHLKTAAPGVAVGVIGIREPIPPGAEFCVEANEKTARAKSKEIIARNSEAIATIELANTLIARKESSQNAAQRKGLRGRRTQTVTQEDEVDIEENGVIRKIIVIVKGDVKGSADAVAQCIQPLGTAQYPLRVLEAGVGDVTSTDVTRLTSIRGRQGTDDEPFLIAFNVRVKEQDKRVAKRAGVNVLSHNLIYHLEDEMKEKLQVIHDEQKIVEVRLGRAGVIRVFEEGRIAGCSVQDGQLSVGDEANVLRVQDVESDRGGRQVVFSGTIESIKQFAKSVRSVDKGSECGIGVEGWSDFLPGDQIESVSKRTAAQVS